MATTIADDLKPLHHPKTWIGKYVWSQDHKVIAIQYGLTAISIGLVALVFITKGLGGALREYVVPVEFRKANRTLREAPELGVRAGQSIANAIRQFELGHAVTHSCPSCGGVLLVRTIPARGKQAQSLSTDCMCHACNGTYVSSSRRA